MSNFDPYHKWLGIPPDQQPPDHYRLLGVEALESDPEVIETAANRQMAYLHGCSTGEHAGHAEQLLNEISEARLCLLDGEKKKAYDASLVGAKSRAPRPRRRTRHAGETVPGERPRAGTESQRSTKRKRPTGRPLLVILYLGTAAAASGILYFGWQQGGSRGGDRTVEGSRAEDSSAAPGGFASPPVSSGSPPVPSEGVGSSFAWDSTLVSDPPAADIAQTSVTPKAPSAVPSPSSPVPDVSKTDLAPTVAHDEGPSIIRYAHGTGSPGFDSYASSGKLQLEAGLGPGKRSKNKHYGGGYALAEIDNVHRIGLWTSLTSYKHYDANSFAGIFLDYHTAAGYTSRVAFSFGMMDKTRTTRSPLWGAGSVPDKYVRVGPEHHYELVPSKWAPPEWDGRVILSVVVQNTGPDSSVRMGLELID